MIRRLYIHNFRCLENFELPLENLSTALLIGKNGSGKTTVGAALNILQKIARGTNRVGDIVRSKDFTRQRMDTPMRFEIEIELDARRYQYAIAFDFPTGFRELRIAEENLTVDGVDIVRREYSDVRLNGAGVRFGIDWHLVALPIIQEKSADDAVSVFKNWLANMLVLRPIPNAMRGESSSESIRPDIHVTNFGAWFAGLIAASPSAYSQIADYLKEVMPDLQDIKNPLIAQNTRSLNVNFRTKQEVLTIAFDDLSDGEKCFMVCAIAIAANHVYGPLLCFWDEPENHLAPSEVGPSIIALRRAFGDSGQLIVASHNPEAIRGFADENTFALIRGSHLEPTICRSLESLRASGGFSGNFIEALLLGDVYA